jgi:hypothetical protein
MSGSAFDFSVITQVTGTLETLSLYAMPGTDNSGLETFNATVTYDQTKVAKVESKKVTSDNVSVTQVTGWGTPVVNKGTGQIGIGITDGSTDGSYALAQSSTPDLIGTITFTLVSGASPVSGNITFTSYSSVGNAPGYINQTNAVAYAACFVTGTLISTPQGASRVEDLAVGAEVTTLLGGRAAEVIWVGTRRIDCTRHPEPSRVWPVRIAAHAFGDAAPSRDLLLSPEHAVYVDGALVPVGALINGTSIVQVPQDHVTYWHIELAQHNVVLAEGLACESYLDAGTRADFDSEGGVITLHALSRMAEPLMQPCARLVRQGAELETIRTHLEARATVCLAPTIVARSAA